MKPAPGPTGVYAPPTPKVSRQKKGKVLTAADQKRLSEEAAREVAA